MDLLDHFDTFQKKYDKEHFIHLVQIAIADGIIDTKELDLLHRFGRKLGFTIQEIDSLIEKSTSNIYSPPYELESRFNHVYEIVRMVMADGVIDDQELMLAYNFALNVGFAEQQIKSMLELIIDGVSKGKDEDDIFTEFLKFLKTK